MTADRSGLRARAGGRVGRIGLGLIAITAAVALALFWVWPAAVGIAGPLDLGDGGSESCFPASADGSATIAEIALTNHTTYDIGLNELRLIDADGVKLVAGYIAPIAAYPDGSTSMFGNVGGVYPPVFDPVDQPEWQQRTAVPGAVLHPGERRQVVLGLVPSGSSHDWSLHGYTLSYHARHRHWTTTARSSLFSTTGPCA